MLGIDCDEDERIKLFEVTDDDGNELVDYEEFSVIYLKLLEQYDTVKVIHRACIVKSRRE